MIFDFWIFIFPGSLGACLSLDFDFYFIFFLNTEAVTAPKLPLGSLCPAQQLSWELFSIDPVATAAANDKMLFKWAQWHNSYWRNVDYCHNVDSLCALALRAYLSCTTQAPQMPKHTSFTSAVCMINFIFSNLSPSINRTDLFFFFFSFNLSRRHKKCILMKQIIKLCLSPCSERGGHVQLGWKMIICSITGWNRASAKPPSITSCSSFMLFKSLPILVRGSESSTGAII